MNLTQEYLDLLDDEYDAVPLRGKMQSSSKTEDQHAAPINHRMATLKRVEGQINRYRKMGLL
jgi:hypothetical protein